MTLGEETALTVSQQPFFHASWMLKAEENQNVPDVLCQAVNTAFDRTLNNRLKGLSISASWAANSD